ncbi:MAG: uroporphyrinogen decarboxylase family protein, partial [Anaerolineae bacterium]
MDIHTTYKKHADASFRRWEAFWNHDVADRIPLVIHFQQETDDERSDFIREDVLQAENFEQQFDLEYVAQCAERAERRFAERATFPDDLLPQVAAPAGLAVTGWLFGCQVEVKAGIPWVEPILEKIEDWCHIIDEKDVMRRFERILQIDKYLSERSGGRYAMSAGALDGPADMVVRLMGEEKLALALYENPDQVDELFAFCTRLWRDLVREKLQNIPTYGGGTATGWSYWLPGKGMALQEDFGQMVSPKHFRERILHYDAQLTEAADRIWFHVHSGAPHMAKEIAKMGAFDGIQICNDYPAG